MTLRTLSLLAFAGFLLSGCYVAAGAPAPVYSYGYYGYYERPSHPRYHGPRYYGPPAYGYYGRGGHHHGPRHHRPRPHHRGYGW